MNKPTLRVRRSDLTEPSLPEPGSHQAIVQAVRMRTSEAGNDVLQVTFRLPDTSAECDRLSDYFVLDGATPMACRISRHRPMSFIRACGVEPAENQEIQLDALIETELQIRIGHEAYEGTRRARVLGYRVLP